MNITNQTATIVLAALATGIYSTSVQAQQGGSTSGTKFRVAHPQTTTDELLQQVEQYSNENQNEIDRVTNVNQLRDVSPTDWAYEALRSLVDRYSMRVPLRLTATRGRIAVSLVSLTKPIEAVNPYLVTNLLRG